MRDLPWCGERPVDEQWCPLAIFQRDSSAGFLRFDLRLWPIVLLIIAGFKVFT